MHMICLCGFPALLVIFSDFKYYLARCFQWKLGPFKFWKFRHHLRSHSRFRPIVSVCSSAVFGGRFLWGGSSCLGTVNFGGRGSAVVTKFGASLFFFFGDFLLELWLALRFCSSRLSFAVAVFSLAPSFRPFLFENQALEKGLRLLHVTILEDIKMRLRWILVSHHSPSFWD